MSTSVKWEAFKAYITCVIINYTSFKSNTCIHFDELINLKTQIKVLELDLYQNDSPGKHKELLLLRTRYRECSTNTIAANFLWLKQSYYDQGDKGGKILACRIKKCRKIEP